MAYEWAAAAALALMDATKDQAMPQQNQLPKGGGFQYQPTTGGSQPSGGSGAVPQRRMSDFMTEDQMVNAAMNQGGDPAANLMGMSASMGAPQGGGGGGMADMIPGMSQPQLTPPASLPTASGGGYGYSPTTAGQGAPTQGAGSAAKAKANQPGDEGGDALGKTLGNVAQAAQIGQAISGMTGMNQQQQMPQLPPMNAGAGMGYQYAPTATQLQQRRLRDIYG